MAASPIQNILLGVIAFIATVWFLRVSWAVTMPLTFALFLAVLLWPLQRRLERALPRWLAVTVCALVLFAAVALMVGAVWLAFTQLAEHGPEYLEQIRSQLDAAAGWLQNAGIPITRADVEATITGSDREWIARSLNSTWSALGVFSIIVFMLVMLLLELSQWQMKARALFTSSTSHALFDTVEAIVEKVQRHLWMRTVVSLMSGVLTAGWSFLLGLDFALLWGLLAFALNYIPNIGSIITFIPPTLVALLQFDPAWALLVAAALIITDTVLGNIVDPWMQGRSLKLSPFIVLVAIVFWGWVWGIAGIILAVPITVSMVVIFRHIKGLRAAGDLLSDPRGEG